MDADRLERDYGLLEGTTDAAVMIQELEWKKAGLSDEDRAPEYRTMFDELRELSDRSLQEDLRHTDPRALFELVRRAKHLGLWTGYEHNRERLKYVGEDETE